MPTEEPATDANSIGTTTTTVTPQDKLSPPFSSTAGSSVDAKVGEHINNTVSIEPEDSITGSSLGEKISTETLDSEIKRESTTVPSDHKEPSSEAFPPQSHLEDTSQLQSDSESHAVDPPTEPNSAQNHGPITKDSPLTDIATSPPVFDLTLGNRDSISSEDHFHNNINLQSHNLDLDADHDLEFPQHQNHHPSHNLLSFLSNNNNSIKEEVKSDLNHSDKTKTRGSSSITDNNLDNHHSNDTTRPKQHRSGSTSHKRHSTSYKDNYESSELSDLGDDSEAETDKMDFLDDEHTPNGEKVSDLRALSELTELAHLKEVDSDDDDDDDDKINQTNIQGNEENDQGLTSSTIKPASPFDENSIATELPNGDIKQELIDQEESDISNISNSTSEAQNIQNNKNDENNASSSSQNDIVRDTDAPVKSSSQLSSLDEDSDHISLNPKENKEAEEEISKHIDQIKNEVAGSTSINSASVKRSLSTSNDEHAELNDQSELVKRQKLENNSDKEEHILNGDQVNEKNEVTGDDTISNEMKARIPKGDVDANKKSDMEDVEDETASKEEVHDKVKLSIDQELDDEMKDVNKSDPEESHEHDEEHRGSDGGDHDITTNTKNEAGHDSGAESSIAKKLTGIVSDVEKDQESAEEQEPEASAEVDVEAEDDDDDAEDEDVTTIKGTQDDDASLATQEEVDLDVQRMLAIQELVSIETSFAELRDKLYQDKLSLLEHELQLCLEGSHPELSKIYFKINDFYQENVKLANANLSYNLKCINTETVATRTSIHQDYLKKLMDTKNDMIADTTSLWYKINKERNQMDQLVPDFNYSAIPSIPNVTIPASHPEDLAALPPQLANGNTANHYSNGVSKHHQQIEQQLQHAPLTKKAVKQNTLIELVQQRNNINHQLGILNGLLQFHGFPSALSSSLSDDKPVPSHELLMRKASEDEIMDDFQAMGIPS